MKTLLRLSVLLLAMAVFPRAQAAPYTNYLDGVSNVIAYAYEVTTGVPSYAREHALLGKALKSFNNASTSVAGDYKIFMAVATALLPLQASIAPELAAPLGEGSTNAYQSFGLYAQTQAAELSLRIAAITPFQGLRRAASNQVAGAIKSLTTAQTTSDVNLGILSVGLALNKLVVARKLVERAESRQGFAPNTLSGTMTVVVKGQTNQIWFADVNLFQQVPADSESDYGTFTYERTGLSSGRLLLSNQNHAPDQEDTVTTVTLRFKSVVNGQASGTFTFTNTEGDKGSGSFTITPEA